MAKIAKTFRFDPTIVKALNELATDRTMVSVLETLIFEEAINSLPQEKQLEIFGDDYGRLLMNQLLKRRS